MKTILVLVAGAAGLAGSALAQEIVIPDKIINTGEVQAAMDKSSGWASVNMAQAAATLDFCGRKDAANDIRQYLAALPRASAVAVFKDAEFDRSGKTNVRSIYVASEASLVKGADMATTATYANLKDAIAAKDKKRICDGAQKTYTDYRDLRQRAAAGRNAN